MESTIGASILKKVGEFIRGVNKSDGCKVCGICCELYGHTVKANEEDLARWRRENRGDISAWILAQGEARSEGCPFLARSATGEGYCSIQSTKPKMCRDYPTKAHGGWCVMKVKHETGEG